MKTPLIANDWGTFQSDAGAISMAMLGMRSLYQVGDGVARDGSEFEAWGQQSVAWVRQGALTGWPQAEYVLGEIYDSGIGVPQDHSEAVRWFSKAAGQDDPNAQVALGEAYAQDRSPSRDYKQSLYWLRKAAEQGNEKGETELGQLYAGGLGVSQDYAEAMIWYRKAADQEYSTSQVNIGYMYLYGWGVPKDSGLAMIWFLKAAEHGNSNADYAVGANQNGHGFDRDYEQAASWYRKGADKGNYMCQFSLGYLYAKGWGVAKDYNQAALWFRKAADQGFANAQSFLGAAYKDGYGVTKDEGQARLWYARAAAQGNTEAQQALTAMGEAPVGAPSALEPVEEQKGDPNLPDVQYRSSAKTKALTESDDRQLTSSLRWLPNEVTFNAGSSARADLVDGAGRKLATVRVTWMSSEQRIIAPQGKQADPQRAWNNSPKTWYGSFTAQLQNNSLCTFKPDAVITLSVDDLQYVVDTVAWSNWLILHDPPPGQQDSAKHDFRFPRQSSTVVLHMKSPQPFSPLHGCVKVDEPTKEEPKVAQASQGGSAYQSPPRSCTWSSEFDQIRDVQMLDSLRGQNWRQAVQQSGRPIQQVITSAEQSLAQFQEHLEQVKTAIQQVSSPPITDFNFTFDYQQTCKINPDPNNALQAAACEYVNTMNVIYATRGGLEIYRCIAGN